MPFLFYATVPGLTESLHWQTLCMVRMNFSFHFSQVFQTKSALRSHTKLHASPEGMFQCPQCPKSFRFQGRLEKHLRKHAEHADICPHCGKVYISKIHLQRHISVVHLGVKDYRWRLFSRSCSMYFTLSWASPGKAGERWEKWRLLASFYWLRTCEIVVKTVAIMFWWFYGEILEPCF